MGMRLSRVRTRGVQDFSRRSLWFPEQLKSFPVCVRTTTLTMSEVQKLCESVYEAVLRVLRDENANCKRLESNIGRELSRFGFGHMRVSRIVEEFARFVVSKAASRDEKALMLSPSDPIDVAWHCVVLDTVLYSEINRVVAQMMALPASFFIHHDPYGYHDVASRQERRSKTLLMYESVFGAMSSEEVAAIWECESSIRKKRTAPDQHVATPPPSEKRQALAQSEPDASLDPTADKEQEAYNAFVWAVGPGHPSLFVSILRTLFFATHHPPMFDYNK